MTKRVGGCVMNAGSRQCALISHCVMLFGWMKFHFVGVMGIETPLSEGCRTCPFIFPLLYMERREPGCSFFPLSALGPASGTATSVCFWGLPLDTPAVCPSAHHHGVRENHACAKRQSYLLKSPFFCWEFRCLWAWMICLRSIGVFSFLIFLYCFFLLGSGTLTCGRSSWGGWALSCSWGCPSALPAPSRLCTSTRGAQPQASRQNCSRERGSNRVFSTVCLCSGGSVLFFCYFIFSRES